MPAADRLPNNVIESDIPGHPDDIAWLDEVGERNSQALETLTARLSTRKLAVDVGANKTRSKAA